MIKIEQELQKTYLTDYSLLTAQYSLQAHYHIFCIILLKEFKHFNVKMNRIIKNVKRVESNTKITSPIVNIQTLKMI